MSKRGIGTRAVHGNKPTERGQLTTPIVKSATFVFESSGEMHSYLEGDAAVLEFDQGTLSRSERPHLDADVTPPRPRGLERLTG